MLWVEYLINYKTLTKRLKGDNKKNMILKLRKNNNASAVPIIYFLLTIVVCGALFSLLFLEVAFPTFLSFIPDSTSKTFILMGLRGMLFIVLFVGIICLIREGIKREV